MCSTAHAYACKLPGLMDLITISVTTAPSHPSVHHQRMRQATYNKIYSTHSHVTTLSTYIFFNRNDIGLWLVHALRVVDFVMYLSGGRGL